MTAFNYLSKLRHAFASVKEFGAKGDGTTNDTAAMQAAHDAAGGQPVYYPEGTYLFSQITLSEVGAGIVGVGSGGVDIGAGTVLKSTASGTNAAITLTTSQAHNVYLDNFALIQNSASVVGRAISAIDTYWLRTRNVRISGFVDNLYAQKAIYHHHERLFSEKSTNGVNYNGSSGVWNVDWFNNVITFDTCRFTECTVTGVYVKGCEVVFINPDFTGMNSTGAIGCKIAGESASYRAHGIKIIAPYVELTKIALSFSYALAEVEGGYMQGGSSVPNQATSIIDADNSTVVWTAAEDKDYWENGYRLTNSSKLTMRTAFSGSIRAGNSVDSTSKVLIDDYDEGSFTATLTGCTTSPTATVTYVRSGKLVTLAIPSISATSNTTNASLTGVPASLTPSSNKAGVALVFDNGDSFNGNFDVTFSGVINLYKGPFSTAFTNVGGKGVQACVISYIL